MAGKFGYISSADQQSTPGIFQRFVFFNGEFHCNIVDGQVCFVPINEVFGIMNLSREQVIRIGIEPVIRTEREREIVKILVFGCKQKIWRCFNNNVHYYWSKKYLFGYKSRVACFVKKNKLATKGVIFIG